MNASANDFHGVWRLLDWSVNLGGETWRPFGGQVEGHLAYHPGSWVFATLMERDRPALSQDRSGIRDLRRRVRDEPGSLSSAEVNDLCRYFIAGSGYVNYSGPFDLDSKSVHHRVQTSLLPQWVGTTLSRDYAFSDNGAHLTLTAAMGEAIDSLEWERLC